MLRSHTSAVLILFLLSVSACDDGTDDSSGEVKTPDAGVLDDGAPAHADANPSGGGDAALPGDGGPPPATDHGCADLFAEDVLATFDLDIAPAEMAALEDEFLNWAEREAADPPLDPNPYHPATLRYQGETVPDVMVRLKGQSSWHETVALDANPKMQFVISFNELDHDARFHGVRKVELDMPRNDWSMLRQRVALYQLRRFGIPAQCASSARLNVNGSYYGLFTLSERQDKEFLQRNFGDQDEGDLWEGGRDPKTNEEAPNWTRLVGFWMVLGANMLDAIADLDASVREWAAECVINDGDGYYGGFHNFYLYDHPTRGYLWLPHDLDAAFDWNPTDSHPIYWSRAMEPGPHYLMVMHDPTWLEKYVAHLADINADYHPAELEALVDKWAAQIADAAAADPHRPFSVAQHATGVASLRASFDQREDYLEGWLACWQEGGGEAEDADGDGADWCHDCDDGDANVYPGAPEVCNALDDDCDGLVDEQDGDAPTCPEPPAP
jgi:hypothetical protein